MAVTELKFSFDPEDNAVTIKEIWGHAGVVASGDLEVMVEKNTNSGKVIFDIKTKVIGFDQVWAAVTQRCVQKNKLTDVNISINDNAATPAVVTKRLQQAINAAGGLV